MSIPVHVEGIANQNPQNLRPVRARSEGAHRANIQRAAAHPLSPEKATARPFIEGDPDRPRVDIVA